MNSTISLEQSVIKEVATLFGDKEALKQVLSLAKRLKKAKKAQALEAEDTEEFISKEEILSDLREAFRELKHSQSTNTSLQTWEEFRHELHH